MLVIVASKNPVKVQAAKLGFEAMFPDKSFLFEGLEVDSAVPDQPIGNEQTYAGAYNRAKNAQRLRPEATYWIGLEGGLIPHTDKEYEAMAWIVVLGEGTVGKSRTAGFYLPEATINLIKKGMELGRADEIVHNVTDSKRNMGTTGLLTDNALNRTDYYVQSVILALIPFFKPTLYH